MEVNKIFQGDCLDELKKIPDESINCCMTSPPYWGLRDYGIDGQLGLESSFQEYINKLCNIFDEVKRVLRKDGTLWVNIGDTYSSGNRGKQKEDKLNPLARTQDFNPPNRNGCGIPDKSLCNVPARFSIEMQNRGWILRNVLIWHKTNCMPSSAKDRFTVDFEYLYFFVKNKDYFFDTQYEPLSDVTIKDIQNRTNYQTLTGENGSKHFNNEKSAYSSQKTDRDRREFVNLEQGRIKRAVWKINLHPFSEAHFATYPEELCETPIKSGCPEFVCKKCFKPREKILKYNNLMEEGHGELKKYDEPYAVQHREGQIIVRDLPPEIEILEYLRNNKNISNKKIADEMKLPQTSVSHWFSDIDSTHGFSYPTKDQWIKLKELLKFDDRYDDVMTKEYYKDAGVMDNEYKIVGLSDCGCNAGFEGGIVLDPFFGAGTTGLVALKQSKNFIGIELNPEYIKIAKARLKPFLEQTKLDEMFEKYGV